MPPQTLKTVGLLVSELVTNAVVHGGLELDERIGLKVGSFSGTVRAEVHDGAPGFEVLSTRRPDPEQVSGWGLYLVQSLSDRWGIEREELIVVWFEIDHG